MDPAKPSLELLRSLTDEHVLRALMQQRRLTRAELAAATGLSKPTVGESVRRLAEAGLVADTGERTVGGRGRGRVGTYYALAGDVGAAMAVSIAPEGIIAECLDAYGGTLSRAEEKASRPSQPQQVAAALRTAADNAQHTAGTAVRLAVVSAADPVDRATGRLVHLPGSPFLIGVLDPAEILAPYVSGPVTVDNDVNWAAQAERDHAESRPPDNFAYLFLGEGIGCAIISDGQIQRGHNGLAGEAAHLFTIGPDGQAMPLLDVFGQLGLRQRNSTAIDVGRLLRATTGPQPQSEVIRGVIGRAIGGVITAITALTDPQVILTGGSWGTNPAILGAIATAGARRPWHVPVRAAELTGNPSLAGARTDALNRLRAHIIATVHPIQS